MLNNLPLAVKLLWREWRAGQWYVVFIALLIAVTTTTSMHFLVDRVTRGLDLQSAKFLGGDLAVSSTLPIPSGWIQQAAKMRLRTAESWSYPSVVSVNNRMQLVNVQAVSDNYPLYGDQSQRPPKQTIWVESRLLPILSIQINDRLTIGAANLKISSTLDPEKDLLYTGWSIAPKVIMRLDDVPATRTVIPGSRVEYKLLIAGEQAQLALYRQWLSPQLRPGQQIQDALSQQSGFRDILQRAENYLTLLLLFGLLMSGVAIALSLNQYLHRHYSHAALWRCLGARQRQIKLLFFWQLLIIGLMAGCIAIPVAFAVQYFLVSQYSGILPIILPAPGMAPVTLGFVTSVVLLFGFSYPIIVQLPETSPLVIWRNEIKINRLISNLFITIALTVITALAFWYMNYSMLILYFLAILLIGIAFLYILNHIFMLILRMVLYYSEGVFRRGISELVNHANSVSLQFIGFNLVLTSLIVLGYVRTDIVKDWQHSFSKQTPNYFAFNIAKSDIASMQTLFKQHNIAIADIYPMVRGRLTALNGKPILTAVPKDAVSNNALHRDLNLSWMWDFPSDNTIIKGSSWTLKDAGKPIVSVYSTLATDLQLQIGDQLTFLIGGKELSATIVNFRNLNWSSFHPNFFMIFPPGLLDTFPSTYITSFHLSSNQEILLNQILQQFPNVTIIDVAVLLRQMQDLINKVAMIIQYLFIFSLVTGGLIFISGLQASMDERQLTYSLLRVLGAGKKYIRGSLIVEFGFLIAMVLMTSFFSSWLIVLLLEQFIFNI